MKNEIAFNNIRNDLEKTQREMMVVVKKFPWHDKLAYAAWLANSYHYANNSTRILALVAGTMPMHLTKLSNRFIQHAAEEKGHERLLENDIAKLGFKVSEIAISPTMQIYYRSLYYWSTSAGSPVGLIGWILSLEALATNLGGWIYTEINKYHGSNCASFLKVHSDADPEHVEKALEVVKLLDNTEARIVADANAMYSATYINILNEIAISYRSTTKAV